MECIENDENEEEKHKKITSIIMDDLGKENISLVKENIERAAFVRGFLG